MPASARCVALVALAETAARLKPLLTNALGQGASVVLISELDLPDLPPEVEIRPVAALAEAAQWADYLAIDVSRESVPALLERLGTGKKVGVKCEAQALILTPMPCSGMADCGVCAVTLRRGWKMACKDGPVFDLDELI
jgi:Iron-sulfur cluster binding domain of dihydroorotate dehydrogenase B